MDLRIAAVAIFAGILVYYVFKRWNLWAKAGMHIGAALDYKLGKYAIRQLWPSAMALVAITLHAVFFGPFSGRSPTVSQTRLLAEIKQQYENPLRAELEQLGLTNPDGIERARRDHIRRSLPIVLKLMAEFPPTPDSRGWNSLAEALRLAYPVVILPRHLPLYHTSEAAFDQDLSAQTRMGFLSYLPDSRFIEPSARRVDTSYDRQELMQNFAFTCGYAALDCKVILPTDVVLQYKLELGRYATTNVIRFPALTVSIEQEVLKLSIPAPEPAPVFFASPMRGPSFTQSFQLADMSVRLNGETGIFPLEALNAPEIEVEWQPHDFGTGSVELESCMINMAARTVDLGAFIPDFEAKRQALCTVAAEDFKASLRRCATRQTVNQVEVRLCDFTTRLDPESAKPGYFHPRYFATIGPVSEATAERFTFDRQEDLAFLTLLRNVSDLADQPVLLPVEIRRSVVAQIVRDYATILGPSPLSPAMNDYIAQFGPSLNRRGQPDWPFDLASSRNELRAALARQPQLHAYHYAREGVTPLIYQKLFAQLKEMGLYPLSD